MYKRNRNKEQYPHNQQPPNQLLMKHQQSLPSYDQEQTKMSLKSNPTSANNCTSLPSTGEQPLAPSAQFTKPIVQINTVIHNPQQGQSVRTHSLPTSDKVYQGNGYSSEKNVGNPIITLNAAR